MGRLQQDRGELYETASVDFIQTVGVLASRWLCWCLSDFMWSGRHRDLRGPALGGFFAFIGFLTFFAALVDGKVSTVVVLSALYPLVTILVSIAFLHERLSGNKPWNRAGVDRERSVGDLTVEKA